MIFAYNPTRKIFDDERRVMPREIRKYSPTGYYHVMTRGLNKQRIFKNDKDRIKYLHCVADSKDKYDIKVVCYCLMPNHTHLVVYDDKGLISRFMQSLNGRYASYYNRKYERIGYLFQDRFKSENILSQRQLLAAYRYVLNNLYKAGWCRPWEYKWNSYSRFQKNSMIVDTTIISDLLQNEMIHKDFVSSYSDEHFIDVEGANKK